MILHFLNIQFFFLVFPLSYIFYKRNNAGYCFTYSPNNISAFQIFPCIPCMLRKFRYQIHELSEFPNPCIYGSLISNSFKHLFKRNRNLLDTLNRLPYTFYSHICNRNTIARILSKNGQCISRFFKHIRGYLRLSTCCRKTIRQ